MKFITNGDSNIEETKVVPTVIVESLRSQINSTSFDKPLKRESTEETTQDIIKNANNQFLIGVLSPQIEKNEIKKRKHKDILLISIAIFLVFQFGTVYYLVFKTITTIFDCHIDNKPLDLELIKIMLTFTTGYITSIVVELVAILKYIVKNVFDTSIAELVEKFRDDFQPKNPT